MQFKKVSISLKPHVLKAAESLVKERKKKIGNRYGLSTFINELLERNLRIKI